MTPLTRVDLSAVNVFEFMTSAQIVDVQSRGLSVDVTLPVQNAIDSLTPGYGGGVFFPAGKYKITNTLIVPEGITLLGSGNAAAVLSYTGSSDCLLIGDTTAGLDFGCSVGSLGFRLTAAGGRAIHARGLRGFAVRDVYIEGVVSGTNEGIFIDGSNASNLFAQLENVDCNHIKIGYRIGTTGSVNATTVRLINCAALCDSVSGSVGLQIDANNGSGVLVVGLNLEQCSTGILNHAPDAQFYGCRFEDNALDIDNRSTAVRCSYFASVDLVDYSNAATDTLILDPYRKRIPPESWTVPTLLNSWVSVGSSYTPGFYKDPTDRVALRGGVMSGTTTHGTVILTLPTGYRPEKNAVFTVQSDASPGFVKLLINASNGDVSIYTTGGGAASTTYTSLDGVMFRAAT